MCVRVWLTARECWLIKANSQQPHVCYVCDTENGPQWTIHKNMVYFVEWNRITIDNREHIAIVHSCHTERNEKKTNTSNIRTEIQLTNFQTLFSYSLIILYFFRFRLGLAWLFIRLFKPNHDQLINTRYKSSRWYVVGGFVDNNKSVAARTLWNSRTKTKKKTQRIRQTKNYIIFCFSNSMCFGNAATASPILASSMNRYEFDMFRWCRLHVLRVANAIRINTMYQTNAAFYFYQGRKLF